MSQKFRKLVAFFESQEETELGVGAGTEALDAAESALGVDIRGQYREFLLQYGWGGSGAVELFGIGGPKFLDLVEMRQSERLEVGGARLPVHLLPVMNDGGGNLLCLDTSVDAGIEPPVVFWDHAAGDDQIPEVVGDTFCSWLAEELDDD